MHPSYLHILTFSTPSEMGELVQTAAQPLTPADAARLYHGHANTLRVHLRAAGLPPLNQIIVWARLFRAAHLLGDPARAVESVAAALAYPSANALRNQLDRYAGLCPREVRAAGGLPALLQAFRAG